MTREDIEQLYVEEPNCFETDREEQWYKVGLKEGLASADSHPQWIPVEEELPKHKVEDNGLITYEEVLVCLNDGYVTTDCYDDTRKKWLGYNGDVEYWMPTPQPPRKEE